MQRNKCLHILKESYIICNDFESLRPFKSFWISLINSLRLHPIYWKFVIIRDLSINITKMSKETFQDLCSLCVNSLSKTANKGRTCSLTMWLCHSWQKQRIFKFSHLSLMTIFPAFWTWASIRLQIVMYVSIFYSFSKAFYKWVTNKIRAELWICPTLHQVSYHHGPFQFYDWSGRIWYFPTKRTKQQCVYDLFSLRQNPCQKKNQSSVPLTHSSNCQDLVWCDVKKVFIETRFDYTFCLF